MVSNFVNNFGTDILTLTSLAVLLSPLSSIDWIMLQTKIYFCIETVGGGREVDIAV